MPFNAALTVEMEIVKENIPFENKASIALKGRIQNINISF